VSRVAYAPGSWSDLFRELDCWREAGRVAPLWWRDDDAVTATPQLGEILRIADGVPLALAVVPAEARPELAAVLRDAPSVSVLQHGWSHANHARIGKKSEYPAERAAAEAAGEIAEGRDRLAALFDGRALPVFVPPWNRIASELVPVLADAGVSALSALTTAKEAQAPARRHPALASIDAHVDVTDWRHGKRFLGTDAALGALLFWLRACRLGMAAPAAPIGILTHHLVMDPETAKFLECLCALIAGHGAARWIDIADHVNDNRRTGG
jgi:peptidoglycan/xylan/chitin deacetylase (PgdA/CDA1 family)